MPDANGVLHLLVLGDSILWGQGLRPQDKIHSLTAQTLHLAYDCPVRVHHYAHSGAWIWAPTLRPPHPDDAAMAAGHWTLPVNAANRQFIGERPLVQPYIWCQLHRAGIDLQQQGAVPDLVLLDGGLNNIGIFEIINPAHDVAWIQQQVENLRGWIHALLEGVHERFGAVPVVVTGYYALLSRLSFSHPGASAAAQILVHMLGGGGLFGVPSQHLQLLSQTFANRINGMLRGDVRQFNNDVGQQLAAFADPRFNAANAYAAPGSLLWELDLGNPLTLGAATDDAVAARRAARGGSFGPEDFSAERCSAGHPNRAGARRYHEAVCRALERLELL